MTTTATPTAEQLKVAGMDRAAENKKSLLKVARKVARRIATEKGVVTMDDVQAALALMDISDRALGNAAGSVFRGPEWKWTGRRIKSKRPHSHANEIKVWALSQPDRRNGTATESEEPDDDESRKRDPSTLLPDQLTCLATPRDQNGDLIEPKRFYLLHLRGKPSIKVKVSEDPATGDLYYGLKGADRPQRVDESDPNATWELI